MLVEEMTESVSTALKNSEETKMKQRRRRKPYPQIEKDIHLLIANRVQDTLDKQGVSHKELAERLGDVTASSLGLMLKGRAHVTAARLKRIADALGINPVTFFLIESAVEKDNSLKEGRTALSGPENSRNSVMEAEVQRAHSPPSFSLKIGAVPSDELDPESLVGSVTDSNLIGESQITDETATSDTVRVGSEPDNEEFNAIL